MNDKFIKKIIISILSILLLFIFGIIIVITLILKCDIPIFHFIGVLILLIDLILIDSFYRLIKNIIFFSKKDNKKNKDMILDEYKSLKDSNILSSNRIITDKDEYINEIMEKSYYIVTYEEALNFVNILLQNEYKKEILKEFENLANIIINNSNTGKAIFKVNFLLTALNVDNIINEKECTKIGNKFTEKILSHKN